MIGLLLVCTNKYDVFLKPLLDSVEKYFFVNHKVKVFLFSDKEYNEKHGRLEIEYNPILPYKFPYASLYRYKVFNKYKDVFEGCTHLFYSDVDMLFVDEVGEEILCAGLTCTQHPGFYKGGWGSQNVDKRSSAYLDKRFWSNYCAGGFQGGGKDEYLKMCSVLNERIDDDESKGVQAEYHDETHFNHYLKTNTINRVLLSPSYCYAEAEWFTKQNHNFKPRLIALEKKHHEIRN